MAGRRKPPPTPAELTETFFKGNNDVKLESLTKSKNHRALKFVKVWDVTKGVRCGSCEEVLPLYSYGADKACAYGFWFTKCMKCIVARKCPFSEIMTRVRYLSKKLIEEGHDIGEIDFDKQHIKKIFNKQKGMCHYLPEYCEIVAANGDGNPLNMQLRRVDKTKGYQKDNIVLICRFLHFVGGNFNKASTRDLIFYNQETDDDYIFDEAKFMKEYNHIGNTTHKEKRKSIKIKDNNGNVTHKTCTYCHAQKAIEEFGIESNCCKPCDNISRRARRSKNRGFIQKMITDAKRRKTKRGLKRRRNDESGEIDPHLIQLVIDKIIEQGNRCPLTGIPFVYQQKHPHIPSIDRIDDSKGYIKGNFRIIVAPLNTEVQLPDDQFEALRQKHFQSLN